MTLYLDFLLHRLELLLLFFSLVIVDCACEKTA